jgi:protein involved in polysaccharide export with SLBB domain
MLQAHPTVLFTRSNMRFIQALLALCVLASFPSLARAQGVDDSGAVLRPGDVVKISVWRKPELSGEFSVAADGSIADAFYSEVNVAGVSLNTATDRVRQYVARIESSPRVWVEPLFRVTVGGEVRTPNLYSLSRETTISQAVAQAGGATAQGRLDRVRLIRNGESQLIDLTDPANPLADTPIRSGDQILVARGSNFFREYIAPASSVVAAMGVILNIFLR